MNTFFQRVVAGVAVAATALLVACGGGSDASGGTAEATYQGTVSGFGSVIVNGVRFDDSTAQITVDDAVVSAGTLKLGMRADVTGTVSADDSTGSASSCTVDTSVRGAVASIDASTNRFTIRGIAVQVDDKTVFEGAGNLAALKVGDWVEVHGSVDFNLRVVQATRVEVKPPEEVGRAVLFGKATGVTATTFTLGDLTVNYAAARLIGFDAAGITEGAIVRVRSNVSPVGNVLQATAVKAVKAPRLTDGTPAAVEGRVQSFVSIGNFLVSGTAVDATNAQFQFGSAADLSEGKRVIVFGTLANGKIVASKIRIFRPDLDGEVRLIGMVSDYVSAASFKVRGVAVDASAAVFEDGTAAELMNGRLVEIKGQSVGAVVKATKVEFEETKNGSNAVLTGVVSSFVSTADFKVAGKAVKVAADVRYINGTAADVIDGASVWLTGSTDAAGVFVAKTVIVSPFRIIGPTQAAGTVADVAADGSFKLNGTLVTTSATTRFIGGTAANLVAGSWVVVTGKVTAGVLAAATVTFPGQSGNDSCKAFKLEGQVYDYVSLSNFKLFGLTLDASAAEIEGGVAADLANGKFVEACGNELPVAGVLKVLKLEFKAR
ncbi:MAG: hypothetical protein AD742_00630 [Methylibium sp. NZG]|nr:MAG: hypothetical protein AD742_00630 [Methylibium sp. NZG]